MQTGITTVDPDHTIILANLEANIIMTCTEATLGHTTRKAKDATGVTHDALILPTLLTNTILATTHHTADHLHTEALQHTPGTAVDHALNQPTDLPERICIDPPCIPAHHEAKHISQGNQE